MICNGSVNKILQNKSDYNRIIQHENKLGKDVKIDTDQSKK